MDDMKNKGVFGVFGSICLNQKQKESCEDWYKTISKASLEYDYSTLYSALWPHIKNIYGKRYDHVVTQKLLDNIEYELSQLYEAATMYVLDERIDVFNLAFKSCIHAAKHWDFDLEENDLEG